MNQSQFDTGQPHLYFQAVTQFFAFGTDKGSRASKNVSFWLPDLTSGYCWTSLFATPDYYPEPDTGAPFFLVQPVNDDPNNPLFALPVEFSTVWQSTGEGTTNLGIYNLVAPPGYIGIGIVISENYNVPPVVNQTYLNLVCVRQDQCHQVTSTNLIWNDKGSGATGDCSLWLLPSGAIYAYPGYPDSVQTWDLKLPANPLSD